MKSFPWPLAAVFALLCVEPALAAPATVPAPLAATDGTSVYVQPTLAVDQTGAYVGPGGGGGGGGDASAANQTTQITAANLTNTTLGAVTASPTANTIGDRLKVINTSIAALLQAGGSIGNTSFGATQSGTWNLTNISGTISLPTGASTAANQTTANTSLATIAGVVASTGSAVPSTASFVAGKNPAGNQTGVATDTGGRLLPGQGVVASARTTLTASTATSISAAVSGRVGLTITTEAALAANVYICTTQTTSCSATVYDFLIPSGAGAGTIYTALFAPNTSVYGYSTGTPILVVNNWTAQ